MFGKLGCERLDDRLVPSISGFQLNEIYLNPPGSTADQTSEFIELRNTGGGSLEGLSLLVLEGENGGTMPNNAGRADEVVLLDVLGHDGEAYAGQEYVVIVDNEYANMTALEATGAFIIVTNWDGSLENGSASYALINDTGFTEDVDYDVTGAGSVQDGVLDGYTYGTDYEAVGFKELSGDTVYGVDVNHTGPRHIYRDSFNNWATDGTPTPGV